MSVAFVKICLLSLLLCLAAKGFSQIIFENETIQDQYSKGDLNYHHYQNVTFICNVDSGRCTLENAYNTFLSDSRFLAPTYGSQPVSDGGVLLLQLTLPGIVIPGLHPIKVIFDRSQYKITNYTLPMHALHPGKVERKIVQMGNALFLETNGEGAIDINKFFTYYSGKCTPAWATSNVVTGGVRLGIGYVIGKIAAMLNEAQCVVDDIWDPVDERFRQLMNSTAPFKKPEASTPPKLIDAKDKNAILKTNSTIEGELIGGTTPEELGKLIFKAVKTNDKNLYRALIHPHPNNDDIPKIEMNLQILRESFPERGLTEWNSMKFSRVTFLKDIGGGYTNDGGTAINGEQVRRAFQVEFTYKNDFIGTISSMTIVTYKGKYFIYNGGGLASLDRL